MENKKKINTVATVTAIAEPIIKEANLQLWDVVFEKEGASWFLRIFIDGEDGLTMEKCEAVTRLLNKALDEADPIAQSYYLEVGSPGIGRKLKKPNHFESVLNKKIWIKTIRPIENQREFIGFLKSYDKQSVTINIEGALQTFALNECALLKLNDDSEFGG